VTLTVSDGDETSTATQRIVAGSTPPSAEITVSDGMYDAGDTISFSASGFDDQDGARCRPAPTRGRLSSITSITCIRSATTLLARQAVSRFRAPPDQLSNTFYRISLTVTDSSGLSTTRFVDVKPNRSRSPSGRTAPM
jgi:hypothetical protein